MANDTQTWRNIESVEDFGKIPDVNDTVSIALQSQYAHSPIYNKLNKLFHEALDASRDAGKLRREVADPNTANGVFLDWWGKRVGVDRYIKVAGEWSRFDDDYFRFLISYRALCNISGGDSYSINSLLSILTGGTVFVVDYLDMSINSIVVIDEIDETTATILSKYGLLNRPGGVLCNLLIIYPDEQIFSFDGADLLPFNQGVFNPSKSITIGE